MFERWKTITGEESVLLDVAGNNAFLMDNQNFVYHVHSGKVDVFAVVVRDGEPCGVRRHLFQLEAGAIAFGISPEIISREGVGLLVCGTIGTKLQRISQTKLEHLAQNEEHADTIVSHLDDWLSTLSGVLNQAVVCDTTSFVETCQNSPSWRVLDEFHATFLKAIHDRIDETNAVERERMTRKMVSDQMEMSGSIRGLAELLISEEQVIHRDADDPLLDVCRKVALPLGITIVAPPALLQKKMSKDPLADIVRASRIRMRRVALQGEWWKTDNGPLIAFKNNGASPVALLQKSATTYQLYDPYDAENLPIVTREIAESLEPFASILYRTLPGRALNAKDLFTFALKGRGGDLAVVIITGLAGGLLGMITPIATGIIFDTIIPGAQLNQLLMLSLALLIGAISATIFEFTRSIALLRIEGRMDQHVQAAVWDRLLELPVPFFRQYSSGDLADRAMGINAIRQTISGTTISAILSGIFSTFNFVLLFWYSTNLAFAAVALTLVAITFLVLTSCFQLKYQKPLADLGGKLSGFVLECITGVTKFRVSGSEGRVFARWAGKFAEQRKIANKSRNINNISATFFSFFPILSTMTIFIMIVWLSKKTPMSTGSFLAFNAAFGSFLQAVLGVATSVIATISILPHYQRCKPILETLPETDDAKAYPGVLTGAIEVNHLTFRYAADSPYILNDVSFQVKPGEFVAMVGSSGSGKSTLLRLLLGFEKAETGGIFYDAQDISTLDIRSVRQQLGVVLQNGQLMSGDIFTNIVGSSLMTIDDAWEAVRMAGFEEDIKAMPMGLHTVISQGGGTLSGGQRQRLMIARALVTKPRILFFDEATSALDNKTQAIVNSSLEKLQTTRIVIAHRLSTIVKADRIYVLDQGKIVQAGTYNELMEEEGLFAELCKRQIA
ncbi:MAG: NHLP bacteriocin export ABC transporter permease/ATPase subunit [Proteobacteria bacterium]|nr:NHLP bacteriocin export ABC transporter permease/ATPase subunit [Pseudomonadota bacterium]